MICPASVHLFVDESRRGSTYLLAAGAVQPGRLGSARVMLRGLCLSGQRRVHFKDEGPSRRREIISRLEALGAVTTVYTSQASGETARQRCLERLVRDLLDIGATRLVLDEEPLLWVPDVVAWCYGNGGDWRRRVAPLVARSVDTDLP
jgi:hypothetical protein